MISGLAGSQAGFLEELSRYLCVLNTDCGSKTLKQSTTFNLAAVFRPALK
jgi:hypothetical protein